MRDFILEVNGAAKRYEGFKLEHVTFSIPRGFVYGLIGENGAGKTTILNAVMNMIEIEEGNIHIFGQDIKQKEKEIKQKIGYVADGLNQIPFIYCAEVDKLMKRVYTDWDSSAFFNYLEKFKLPKKKKVEDLSKGMKTKLNFAVALSHKAELLILDEATSALDPVVRDEMIDLIRDYCMDGKNSVLMASHITSDLDKIADYFIFIHEGKIKFIKSKEEINNQYGILKCRASVFEALDKSMYDAYIKETYCYKVLLNDKYKLMKSFKDMETEKVSAEDLMLFYVKGEVPCRD